MADVGDTFIDIDDATDTLPKLLDKMAAVARVALLTVEGLCHQIEADEEPDPDLVLLQNILWPLQSFALAARDLERQQRLQQGGQ